MPEVKKVSAGKRPEKVDRLILTINSGSSSVKFSLYRMGLSEVLVFQGKLDRIGVADGHFQAQDASGKSLVARAINLPDHGAAFETLFGWFQGHHLRKDLHGVGHRLVHGGVAHTRPVRITPDLLDDLQTLVPLAPDHLPHQIQAIKAVERIFPDFPQVACFDTAFHRRMPAVAQAIALPPDYAQRGIIRYGFHGLSYEYLLQELTKEAGEKVARGRVIIAHLGNGASMAALQHGASRDTTMGLTPTGGLVMSTRCGDLDPGVILYLLQEQGLTPEGVNYLLNHQAGLLGVSGISSDMQDLLAQEGGKRQAAEAVALFCYQAKKFLGALTAALGGLDTLVFTGGIGENSSIIRQRICGNLEFFGIGLDAALNDANAAIISSPNSQVTVRVMKTNEELMIARHTSDCLG